MEHELEYKITPTEFKAVGDKGEYEGFFSVFNNPDDGYPPDIVHPGAFLKTIAENGKRVRVFYLHDWEKLLGPPPARLEEQSKGLFAAGRLTLDSFYAGQIVWPLLKDGALNEGSIGYQAVKYDWDDSGIRHLREVKLYEVSMVPLGMNPLTQIQAVKRAVFRSAKAVLPPKEMPKADTDAWTRDDVLAQLTSAKQLRMAHAWVNPESDPDDADAYKFAHHLADGTVSWKGLLDAAAQVLTDPQIPETEIAGVKKHLELHFKQFEKAAPWAKSAGETYLATLALVTGEIKAGRVLSAANVTSIQSAMQSVKDALEVMQELLDKAEPAKMNRAQLERRARALELGFAIGG